MRRIIFLLANLWLLAGLVACGSLTPEATPTPPEPSATPKPTFTPAAAESTPDTSWQIPEIQPGDWVRGGADAGLILVEYSDFQ